MRVPAIASALAAVLPLVVPGVACRRGTASPPISDGSSSGRGEIAHGAETGAADPAIPPDARADAARVPTPGAAEAEADLGEPAGGCPAGSAPIEGLPVCIDRWEASIESGRAVSRPGRTPAARTSWREAEAACRAAGRRLCTLAEWEAACAGAAGRRFPYGDEFVPGRCNDAENSAGAARPSGSLPDCATPEGVFDLSGNVWEWTADLVQEGEVHELRGGAWGNGETLLRCRPDERLWQPADEPHTAYGFRCCVDR